MWKRLILLIVLVAAGSMPCAEAQTGTEFFIQLADPQFGASTADRDFVQETANYEFAVANVNRLRPKFVIICGDLINKVGDPIQAAEYFRITAKIDPSIPVYAVAGNHDVGNEPTPETLADYRQHFGKDYYSFREGGIYGIVLDSDRRARQGTVASRRAGNVAEGGTREGEGVRRATHCRVSASFLVFGRPERTLAVLQHSGRATKAISGDLEKRRSPLRICGPLSP